MASKRERIMQRIETILTGTSGIGGRVYRSDPEAATRGDQPCIMLSWSNESGTPETVTLAERTLSVQVEILVRGDVPDTLADPIAESAHALLMADPQLQGNAIDMTLGDARFDFESADQTAGRLTHEYQVRFRHSYASLTN